MLSQKSVKYLQYLTAHVSFGCPEESGVVKNRWQKSLYRKLYPLLQVLKVLQIVTWYAKCYLDYYLLTNPE